MSEFHDPFPNYEMLAHHSEEHGKKARRKLWNVFWLLLVVTLIEVFVGVKAHEWGLPHLFLKFFFIGFTVVKAFYIVYSFMHLGDEVRWAKWMIIAPFSGFILYLIVMLVMGEGNYAREHRLDPPANTEQVPNK
ncbi:MAG: cytochrome C oxidase subunit IV family protein [Bacteroidetes bacterium]|nr:cytochrome C oxidase subunit IV family protein [Bacteroidota bacterium]